jgi:hypothetical protein
MLLRYHIEQPLADTSQINFAFHTSSFDSPYTTHAAVDAPSGPIRVARILKELFALPNNVTSDELKQLMLTDGYQTILPSSLLCRDCLAKLVHARLWIWWYSEKARGRVIGNTLQDNCW